MLGPVPVNAVTEQLILTLGFFGSTLTVAAVWIVRRIRRRRRRVQYGRAVTERLPKFQEPGRGALLVVAGNYDEYQRYCAGRRLNRFHDAVFVQYASTVRERPGSRYVVIGSAMNLPNIGAIMSSLTYTDCKPE